MITDESKRLLTDEAYGDLENAVGPENISREPAMMDGYAWQTLMNEAPMEWLPRPEAVVLPASTEEVQAVVKACNRHGLKFKAISTGWGGHASPGSEGVVTIDLRRMDRILEIDEKNMYAWWNPTSRRRSSAEAMSRGLHATSSGPALLILLASATSIRVWVRGQYLHGSQPPQPDGGGMGAARRGNSPAGSARQR